MLKMLDLFSGIGGFSLAASWTGGIETVAFCEIEPFCQKVLKQHWPDVPIYSDIKELNGYDLVREHGAVDIVCGGFPCQPFSFAGKRRGTEDDRHLWPEMFRIIQETKPAWIIGENVVGLIDLALEQCFIDLESAGYEVQPFIIPACGVEAPHRRDRVWIVAHSIDCRHFKTERGINAETVQIQGGHGPERSGGRKFIGTSKLESRRGSDRIYDEKDVANTNSSRHLYRQFKKQPTKTREHAQREFITGGQDVADTKSKRLQRERTEREQIADTHGGEGLSLCSCSIGNQWAIEPDVGRVADGIPDRSHRLKALGNSIVPQVVYPIFEGIVQIERSITNANRL